ncbi:MAG TPA: alpha/beta hydrolase [Steroidobacteraceae bacterium]|nr:alpha/beta hydrolase [Steroidobacteraceae bacterium]
MPGLGNSGPDHWQSHWERRDPTCQRVPQSEWDAPDCADWIAGLEGALACARGPVVLAAHSAACAMVAHWASRPGAGPGAVRGALLVAPSDPQGPNYPKEPTGFAPMPQARLPFRSIVVASDADPYVDLERAREYAQAWGSELVVMPGAGHINVASGHGPWPEGFELLDGLRRESVPARTPVPPYYTVIFSSRRTRIDDGYGAMADRMLELAADQPGFLGVESARGADGFGITVSYWASKEAIAAWKANAEHRVAQASGRRRWYEHFEVRIARVERAYGGP